MKTKVESIALEDGTVLRKETDYNILYGDIIYGATRYFVNEKQVMFCSLSENPIIIW